MPGTSLKLTPDDNKYVDAAIVGGADFLVTNDQHFNVLAKVNFPCVTVLSIPKFLAMLTTIEG